MKQAKKAMVQPTAIGLVFDLSASHEHFAKLSEYCIHPMVADTSELLSISLVDKRLIPTQELPIDPFVKTTTTTTDINSSGTDSAPNSVSQSPHKAVRPVPEAAMPDLVKVIDSTMISCRLCDSPFYVLIFSVGTWEHHRLGETDRRVPDQI